MAIRYYLVPTVTSDGVRVPEYVAGQDVDWRAQYYGLMPTALVAVDVTTAQHNWLASQPGVTSIPADLDQNIPPGAVDNVRAELEDLRIPGN